jgi:hypothetical protein
MMNRVYLWGRVEKGVQMSKPSYTHLVPTQFKEVQPYHFSSICIQQDFALGIGHSVKLAIQVPPLENTLDQSTVGSVELLAIPVYDGFAIQTFDDLIEVVGKLDDVPITLLNDFDVPWVQQSQIKMARVPRKKVHAAKQNEEDDEDDEEEKDEDEEEDEEEEEEKGSESQSETKSNQQDEDDDDDEATPKEKEKPAKK